MKRDDLPAASVNEADDAGVLRFLTCGSVDDGKSTLIGRLLYDSKTILSDTIATLQKHAQKRGLSAIDLSLLTDGLTAEREQGITIDVAYRYFATPRRKFIIADAPGHEQYTRNMVTAASTADVAVLLIDARKGVLPQTRRHATIATLLGVRRLVLAVNKMDLVGYSQAEFERIVAEFQAWLSHHPEARAQVDAVPCSALEGDMVVERGTNLGWYHGPTLIELLEATPSAQLDDAAPARFPVQWVCRPSQSDFRGYAGRIESGTLSVGDQIVVLPSGHRSRITRLAIGEQELATAIAGQSVMVSLADEIDISRGDMLVRAAEALPEPRQALNATVCWLGSRALDARRTYVLRQGTRETRARVAEVTGRLDIHALEWQAASSDAPVALNDLVRINVRTQHPVIADVYNERRATGSFILIDEATNDTVAAGLITE
ncbi:MAG TPA: GTP-binding protein [Burkholderiaceae bacterium]|nr:GTP-binding protein [Burkholderiaceae bacterium]